MTTHIKIGAEEYNSADYTIPAERTFRGAWEANTEQSVISVDMILARDIWRNKIRSARVEQLASLDTAYMKALETNSDTTQIVADKQALRDAPALSSINLASTPEQLVSIQPIPNVVIK